MTESSVRVAFVTGRPVWREGGRDWTDAGLGRLVDGLAARFPLLRLLASGHGTRRLLDDHALGLPNAAVDHLPIMPSTRQGLVQTMACLRAIRSAEARADVLVVQLPFQAPVALLRARRPRVYHVCGDVVAVVRASRRRVITRAVAVATARLLELIQLRATRRRGAVVVGNGQELASRYGGIKARAVVSATIRAADLDAVSRRRRPSSTLRVLFVGYPRPEKGLDVLLDAVELVERDVELHLVGLGTTEIASEVMSAIERVARRVEVIRDAHLPFGDELFQAYADADVLVVPSRSEGTPRVVGEARAFSCPVIASAVGGIPSMFDDGVDGILVPPGDVKALAAAIRTLCDDEQLRRSLATAGHRRASTETVEAMVDEIARAITDVRQSVEQPV